ncbi:hypothetical protein GOODEAATRI_001826, partial [Goodea atripinnis]
LAVQTRLLTPPEAVTGVCLACQFDISGFKVTHGSRVVEQTVANMASLCGLQHLSFSDAGPELDGEPRAVPLPAPASPHPKWRPCHFPSPLGSESQNIWSCLV